MLHMAAAEESAAAQSPTSQPAAGSVREDMLRYFRLTDAEYKRQKIRADDMLDGLQSAASVAQLASSALELSGKFTLLKKIAEAPATQPATKPAEKKPDAPKPEDPAKVANAKAKADGDAKAGEGDAKAGDGAAKADPKKEANDNEEASNEGNDDEAATPAPLDAALPKMTPNDVAKLAEALSATIEDSPTDRIDRAYDFYNLFHSKILFMFGRDSRAFEPAVLWQVVQRQRVLRELKSVYEELGKLEGKQSELEAQTGLPEAVKQDVTRARGNLDEVASSAAAPGLDIDIRLRTLWTNPLDARRPTPATSPAAVKQHVRATEQLKKRIEQLKARANELETADTQPAGAWPDTVDRLVYLAFPVSVTPGSRANQMTGVRIRITGTSSCVGGEADRDSAWKARVIAPFPQRTYDLQSELSVDLSRRIFDLALTGSGPLGGSVEAEGSLKNRTALESERRRNFLTRMSKLGAYVDGPNHEFGWNFLPTNLQVDTVSPFSGFLRAITFQPPRDYNINAYLDAATYNCGVYVVVNSDVRTIFYQTDYVIADLDQDGNGGPESRYFLDKNGQRQVITRKRPPATDRPKGMITLPAASAYELQAAVETSAGLPSGAAKKSEPGSKPVAP